MNIPALLAITSLFLLTGLVLSTEVKSNITRQRPFAITSLGQVNGVLCDSGDDDVATYLGIRYAQPPVGALRWAAPVRYNIRYPLSGLNTSSPGPGCWQGSEGDEDCLYLNVWAPANVTALRSRLPVRVFIHGGGYQTGHGSEPMYDGCKLVKDGNVVFVTFNYRLGALGFLALPELRDVAANRAVGNWGLMDQRLALQWIRDNIAAFGGDPRKVLLSGESAGAYSSLLHLVSPGSRGLFSGVVSFSGSADAMAVDFLRDAYRKGSDFRQALNCTYNAALIRGYSGTADCLRNTEVTTVLAVQASLCTRTVDCLVPTIDGVSFQAHPVKLMQEGRATRIPVLLGVNSNEGALEVLAQTGEETNIDVEGFFAAVMNLIPVAPSFWERLYTQYNADAHFEGNWIVAAFNAVTDGGYHCPSRRAAQYLALYGIPVRFFILAPSQPNSGCPVFVSTGVYLGQEIVDFVGALHGYDIPFSFLAPYRAPYNQCPFTANETQLASFLSGITSAMAASGSPLPPRSATLTSPLLTNVPSWPTWNLSSNPIMIIDTAGLQIYSAADLSMDTKCKLWDDILAADIAAGSTIHS